MICISENFVLTGYQKDKKEKKPGACFYVTLDSLGTKRKLQCKLKQNITKIFSHSLLGVWQIPRMGLVFTTRLRSAWVSTYVWCLNFCLPKELAIVTIENKRIHIAHLDWLRISTCNLGCVCNLVDNLESERFRLVSQIGRKLHHTLKDNAKYLNCKSIHCPLTQGVDAVLWWNSFCTFAELFGTLVCLYNSHFILLGMVVTFLRSGAKTQLSFTSMHGHIQSRRVDIPNTSTPKNTWTLYSRCVGITLTTGALECLLFFYLIVLVLLLWMLLWMLLWTLL